MATVDPALVSELDSSSDAQRREVHLELERRAQADRIAAELGLDPHDVRVILKTLALSPSERLRRGLSVGRLARRRVAE